MNLTVNHLTKKNQLKKEQISFSYEVWNALELLPEADQALFKKAREVTQVAYAPYSRFCVGAAAVLQNGKTITGTRKMHPSRREYVPKGCCCPLLLPYTQAYHCLLSPSAISIKTMVKAGIPWRHAAFAGKACWSMKFVSNNPSAYY